jgi:ATP-dependent Clp protease ATP-binding subunit ClpA
MARLVQSTLKAPLANEILFGKLASGGIARVDLQDGAIAIHCEPAKADDAAN